ncbi:DUF5615 family PIN-like protein [Oceanicaulis sp.]|uniref:DUF5615 family PIN-like protein n=1 Tax=Oceanicaulis sp. TaxID=1924941 RepID=UPI003D2C7AF5|tara:strand:+ start:276 stop:602 length:327 start_codon:yes stop_codon:yes gene_type:complete
MRFLVDQMLPVWLADWISDQGEEAEHVRRIGLSSAPDAEIAAEAQRRSAVLITKDADFSRPPGPGVSVIWVRMGNTTHAALSARWPMVWPAIISALEAGETLIEVRRS